ncbi:TPA: hypothetical protein HA278_01850 [Candidatus Woesearchaeota archaeon]|nr:hypothetical protein [archaeon]HIJ10778.1 hypothetical protein [Candidatus Woesearchaeota archaeon]
MENKAYNMFVTHMSDDQYCLLVERERGLTRQERHFLERPGGDITYIADLVRQLCTSTTLFQDVLDITIDDGTWNRIGPFGDVLENLVDRHNALHFPEEMTSGYKPILIPDNLNTARENEKYDARNIPNISGYRH